jgi:hypothetical protein
MWWNLFHKVSSKKGRLNQVSLLITFCGFLFLFIRSGFAEESLMDIPDPVPVKIQTGFFLIDVREIEGPKHLFHADIALRLRWKDVRLAGGKHRTLGINEVWNPRIQIVNRVTLQPTLPELLDVDPEGNVLYRQRYVGQFSCRLNLKDFPFDRQTIPVRIAALGFSPDQVHFVSDPETNIAETLSITDWKISSPNSKLQPYQLIPGARALASFIFEFQAERSFNFFLVQIIIPMALIVGMSWIVFWLDPNQPGPRISISITSMLTIVAYRLLLGNFLPRLSFLTRMDYFVFGCTFLVFLSLVSVVLIHRLLTAQKDTSAKRLDQNAKWIFPASFLIVALACFLT